MRILMLTHEFPPYPGGVGRYCTEMHGAAVRQGHTVDVLAPDFGESGVAQGESGVHRFPGGVFRPSHVMRAAAATRRMLSQARYDVVHVADWPMLLALHWAARLSELNVVMTFHGTDAAILGSALKPRLLGSRRASSFIRRACANSRFTLDLVRRELPAALRQQVVVTPLGVAQTWFELPSEAAVRAARNLANASPADQVVLTVARLDRRKGHANSLRAIGALPDHLRRRTKYLAIGVEVERGYRAQLEALASELNVSAVFAGRQPDDMLKGAYGAADLFMLAAEPDPARVEGFGLVLLEAAAQGLPSLARNVHAIPEVIDAGVTGWLYEGAGDASSISRSLEGALARCRESKLRAACIAHAARYTWERCATLTYGVADAGSSTA